jgi:hypothetical protein
MKGQWKVLVLQRVKRICDFTNKMQQYILRDYATLAYIYAFINASMPCFLKYPEREIWENTRQLDFLALILINKINTPFLQHLVLQPMFNE